MHLQIFTSQSLPDKSKQLNRTCNHITNHFHYFDKEIYQDQSAKKHVCKTVACTRIYMMWVQVLVLTSFQVLLYLFLLSILNFSSVRLFWNLLPTNLAIRNPLLHLTTASFLTIPIFQPVFLLHPLIFFLYLFAAYYTRTTVAPCTHVTVSEQVESALRLNDEEKFNEAVKANINPASSFPSLQSQIRLAKSFLSWTNKAIEKNFTEFILVTI